MSTSAHYAVGIDLGTTNSVLSYVDLQEAEQAALHVLPIPQLFAPGVVDSKPQLPSFLYQAHAAELAPGDRVLPWTAQPPALVGEIARHLGAKSSLRLVSSAKSWLCHAGVDCRSAILPLQAPEEVARISPLQTAMHYLEHLRDAWNAAFPAAPLTGQPLTITVPASFDPAARELTVEAARSVGLGHAVLLEEPQAALYSWIQTCGDWRDQVGVGDVILVVDVGGGTTDLSLIAVSEEDGNLVLQRIAIGDHILLGGDNMDLALAYTLKTRLEAEGRRLENWQVQALTHGCRDAKEKLLADADLNEVPVVVPNRGSQLIGGILRTALTRADLDRVLLDGFFPYLPIDQRPMAQTRAGLTTLSLPYAQDARITCHLAAFLSRQSGATDGSTAQTFARPSAVLLNGGVFKAGMLAERLLDVLNRWLQADGAAEARLLRGADLDLAVARGAAYYGYVRLGHGVRIRGGTAAAYYVGVESAMPAVPGFAPPLQALCIAPFGMEEGDSAALPPYEFGLVVGEPVRFRFFASTTRRDDAVGALLEHWAAGELEELDEIAVTLPVGQHRAGEVVPVNLAATYTEVGTLQMDAIATGGAGRWKVELSVRQQDTAAPV
ncbi:MAG: Hsp70 family protein [Methylococcaceae bacterium]|nr:MAG: Hsp70 family protein [Methylococcaceae bacterium]